MRSRLVVLLLALLVFSSATVAAPRRHSTPPFSLYLPVVRTPKLHTQHVYVSSHYGGTVEDAYRVIGEIRNQLNQPVYHVSVTGTFYSGDPLLVGTAQTTVLGTVTTDVSLPQTDANSETPFQLSFPTTEQVSAYTLDVAYTDEVPVEYVWITAKVPKLIWREDGMDFTLRFVNEHETRAITDLHVMIEINHYMETMVLETIHREGVTLAPGESYYLDYTYNGRGNGLGFATQAVLVP